MADSPVFVMDTAGHVRDASEQGGEAPDFGPVVSRERSLAAG